MNRSKSLQGVLALRNRDMRGVVFLPIATAYFSDGIVERESANCKDLTDRDYYVPCKEHLHFPILQRISVIIARHGGPAYAYLLPTAAFFISDFHIKNAARRIPMPHRRMVPIRG